MTKERSRGAARLGRGRVALAVAGWLLIVLAWFGVARAESGLVSRELAGEGGTPLLFLAPEGATGAPGVVIAHGFAGSKPFMLGFGQALARAGYGVMLLDFDGHGRAGGALDRAGGGLQRNVSSAYNALIAQPEIDPARVALLGHSMGSGAVMQAAIDDPDRFRAVVAVSPTGADVTPERPPNLLLMAGTLEPNFLANGRDLLARAGGASDDLLAGRGRALIEIPNVEHITIVFSGRSYQTALDWLNRVFERPAATVAPDRRVVWYAVHAAGWLVLAVALSPLVLTAPLVPAAPAAATRRGRWAWLGLPLGALAAAGAVALLGRVGDIGALGGMLVGGAVALWFLVLGLVWLLVGFRVPRPAGRDLLWGLALFALLSLAVGLMADRVWLSWALIPARLLRWPVAAAASLPWLLAAGLTQWGASPLRRAGWWLYQTAVVVVGLVLTLLVAPDLGFVALLLPVIPVLLALMAIAGAVFDRPWAYGLGNALFFGWLLVAVFPLA